MKRNKNLKKILHMITAVMICILLAAPAGATFAQTQTQSFSSASRLQNKLFSEAGDEYVENPEEQNAEEEVLEETTAAEGTDDADGGSDDSASDTVSSGKTGWPEVPEIKVFW